MGALVPIRRNSGWPVIDADVEPVEDNVTMEADGGAVVDLRPSKKRRNTNADDSFDANLADEMEEMDLDFLASNLIEAIDDDDRSRSGWLQAYERSIDLLGIKIDDAPAAGAGALTRPSIRAPLLLEACIRMQSTARGELLPADGPAKVRVDDNDVQQVRDLAKAFERDLNHYLTVTATEYYPDFDRMLFHVGFAGCAFRKIYHDPLRGRPVSESVYAPDLIVSQDITDLENATRVTHKIQMRQSIMRRMQLLGVYRDIDLIQPSRPEDAIGAKVRETQGLAAFTDRPEDQPYEVLECYCEQDLQGFEHMDGGNETGLPLPYQVTIERTSRKILAIRRNWRESDALMRAVPRFVKYGMGSGLGFYDLGFAHILGNTTRTLTAIWRLLIEAGMFSNFPGFLLKKGARVGTTNIQVGPGQAREVETGSTDDIRAALMPLPYKEPSQVLMEFAKQIEDTARRIAGMGEIQVGEGKQEAPVGTTLALIEQAQKTMQAVHKRLHQAQQQELRILQELFSRSPKSLWSHAKSPARVWQAAQEVSNFDLVPASDPNVSSQMERVMKVQGLVQLSQAMPGMLNPREIASAAVQALGWDDYARFMAPEQPPGAAPPDPKVETAKIKAETERFSIQAKAALQDDKQQGDQEIKKLELARDFAESQDRAMDRASREKIAQLSFQSALAKTRGDQTKGIADLAFSHLNQTEDRRQSQAQHRDEMASAQADRESKERQAKSKAKKTGISGYADGGRVLAQDSVSPIVHVHPQVVIQSPKRGAKEILFTFDDNGNVKGARLIDEEAPDIEVEIEE